MQRQRAVKDALPCAPRSSKHTVKVELGELAMGPATQDPACQQLLQTRPELQQLERLMRLQLGIHPSMQTSLRVMRDQVTLCMHVIELELVQPFMLGSPSRLYSAAA